MNDTIQTIAAVVSSLTGIAALVISLRKEGKNEVDSVVISEPQIGSKQLKPKIEKNTGGLLRKILGVLVPGYIFVATNGWKNGKYRFLKTIVFVVLAFAFFGPIWGELLFPQSELNEAGLIPFIICTVGAYLVPFIMVSRKRI